MGTSSNKEALNNFIPNKYQFVINGIEDVVFNVSSGSLPGINGAAVQTPYRKSGGVISGDRLIVDEITLNFLLDEQFLTYKTALEWLENSVIKMDARDVTILLKTSQNTPNVQFTLINTIPISLGTIELSSIDDSLEAISVPFTIACDRIKIN